MSNERVVTVDNDPLKSVADALDAAVQTATGGVKNAKAIGSRTLLALGSILAAAAYKTCYAASYGIVFPVVLVARAIPTDNAVGHGFIDGARAALDTVKEMKTKPLLNERPATT